MLALGREHQATQLPHRGLASASCTSRTGFWDSTIQPTLPPQDSAHSLLWVVDFPMFERDEEAGRLVALHHPFTAPNQDDIAQVKQCVGM